MKRSGSGHEHVDVVVVGAGHNGLTAACYLAKAGYEVLVVEASPEIGGMTSTYATIPGAPDHLVNEGAVQASLFRATTIESDLDLARYGFRQIVADPQHLHLGPDGESLAIWRDPVRTADELRRFSKKDAQAWLDMSETLDVMMDAMLAYMASHPTRPSVKEMLKGARSMARHPKTSVALSRYFSVSHAQIIDEAFETPLVRGSLAQMPTFDWMRRDGTAWGMIYVALVHRTNSSRFVGGTGALPSALEACLVAHGGRVRTSAPVEEILCRNDRVVGVKLSGGEEIQANAVLAACDPKQALDRLLPKGTLPAKLETAAAHIPTTTTGAGHMKVNVALRGRLQLPRHTAWRRDELDVRKPVTCWHTFEEHVAGWDRAVRGDWPERQPFLSVIPTAIDPTQAPEGQDTLWIWSGVVPNQSREPWESVRDRVGDAILADCADYYDGIEELIIDHTVLTPGDVATRFNVSDGNVYHVDPSLMRFGPLRPAQGLADYASPVQGLFLGGGGMHPSAGICGLPGQLAARTMIRKLRKDRGIRRLLPARPAAPSSSSTAVSTSNVTVG
jgi:phytoene dehydrogenase-like protein